MCPLSIHINIYKNEPLFSLVIAARENGLADFIKLFLKPSKYFVEGSYGKKI